MEIDGAVIGYLGERDFEGIDSAFFNKDYVGATITLLDDIAPTSDDTSGKACSILVGISCTLDWNGHIITSDDVAQAAIYILPTSCTSGGFTIQDSSDEKTGKVLSKNGAAILTDAPAFLMGGTYIGNPAIDGKNSSTLISAMLANYGKDSDTHYAYFDEDGNPIINMLNEKELTGTVTVKECNHDVSVCEYQPIDDISAHQKTCLACGYTETHDFTYTARNEPTCTKDGNIAYWKCDDCGTCFSDENGETEINQSKTVISATGHKYSDGKCTECGTFEDGIGAHLAGHSISLDGNIGVNFYMELDESVIEDSEAYMQFTLPNGDIQTVKVGEAKQTPVDDKTYYVFSCNVAAKEMFDTITAQIISGDKKSTVYEYSVMEYADCILLNPDNYDDKTVKLVR